MKTMMLFLILIVSRMALAQGALQATQDITIPKGSSSIVIARGYDGNPQCELKYTPSTKDRGIVATSFFIIKGKIQTSTVKMTTEQLRDYLMHATHRQIDPSSTMDQLNAIYRDEGFTDDPTEMHTSNFNIVSQRTGIKYLITCTSKQDIPASELISTLFDSNQYGLNNKGFNSPANTGRLFEIATEL